MLLLCDSERSENTLLGIRTSEMVRMVLDDTIFLEYSGYWKVLECRSCFENVDQ